MKKYEEVGFLIARLFLSILFIVAGFGKIMSFNGTYQYMESMHIPGALLPLVILLEFGGGLAILFGFLTRFTAISTAIFTLVTAAIFHNNLADQMQSLMLMKNISITGGFLILSMTGPGKISIDYAIKKYILKK